MNCCWITCLAGALPFVVEEGFSEYHLLGAEGNSHVHQSTIFIAEILLEVDTISVGEYQMFQAAAIVFPIDGKDKLSTMRLRLVEHPIVKEGIIILHCR